MVNAAVAAHAIISRWAEPTDYRFRFRVFFSTQICKLHHNPEIASQLVRDIRVEQRWCRSICGRSISGLSEIDEFAGLLLYFYASYVNENTTVQFNVS